MTTILIVAALSLVMTVFLCACCRAGVNADRAYSEALRREVKSEVQP